MKNFIFFNDNGNVQPPEEFLKYQYRRLFNLSARQLEEEPVSDFFTNMLIYGYIQTKKADDMRKQS